MEYTDIDYTGWKNGKCLCIASKLAGNGAEKKNAVIVAKMVREGYEIRELSRSEAADAHLAAITQPQLPTRRDMKIADQLSEKYT